MARLMNNFQLLAEGGKEVSNSRSGSTLGGCCPRRWSSPASAPRERTPSASGSAGRSCLDCPASTSAFSSRKYAKKGFSRPRFCLLFVFMNFKKIKKIKPKKLLLNYQIKTKKKNLFFPTSSIVFFSVDHRRRLRGRLTSWTSTSGSWWPQFRERFFIFLI